MKLRLVFAFSLLLAAAGHVWSRAGRGVGDDQIDLALQDFGEHGMDGGRGNLVGIQPFMTPADYASERRFHAKLKGYLDAAQRRGWLGERTIVVLPEYVGTWLVVAGEKREVFAARSVAAAMQTLILSNLPAFVLTLLSSRAKDRVKDSLFRMKAPWMSEIYHRVFSSLARQYRVTMVAGSILLPSAEIRAGKLLPGDGFLENVSVVYRPDGQAYERLVRKVFPIETELPFVAPASGAALPVFDTPAGRLGVLVCADSWQPAAYEALKPANPDLIVVPSYLSPDGIWNTPWQGYNGTSAPDDVPSDAAGSITEGEAWLKYALPGRIARAGAAAGLNVFLRGSLWDLGSDGHTLAVRDGEALEGHHVAGAALFNLWL